MSTKTELVEKLLHDLYAAMREEIREVDRDDIEITLTPYGTPDELGATMSLVPIDGVSLEDVGTRCTITKLVDDDLNSHEVDAGADELDDDIKPILTAFAVELEQCAAKIRSFLAKYAPEVTS